MDPMTIRNSAGSFELKEGTGEITGLYSIGDALEVYKVDKTFHLKTPETIDPQMTNPNAPWVASPVADVGSANKIVARVFIQGCEILKMAAFDENVDKDLIVIKMHTCKEVLLSCERIKNNVVGQIDEIVDRIQSAGVGRDNNGRALNPFPQIANLDAECGMFLVLANRVIKLICELPQIFMLFDSPDSNFDKLSKRLLGSMGNDEHLLLFVQNNSKVVEHIINLRNFHEHPRTKKTVIHNFKVMPSGDIQVPYWEVLGGSEVMQSFVKNEMNDILNFLIQLAEWMVIHLVMHNLKKEFPYIVQEIADEDIDPKKPIKYQLSIDFSRLGFINDLQSV